MTSPITQNIGVGVAGASPPKSQVTPGEQPLHQNASPKDVLSLSQASAQALTQTLNPKVRENTSAQIPKRVESPHSPKSRKKKQSTAPPEEEKEGENSRSLDLLV